MNTKFNPSLRLKSCKGCYFERKKDKSRCKFCSRNSKVQVPLRGFIEDSYITKDQLKERGFKV